MTDFGERLDQLQVQLSLEQSYKNYLIFLMQKIEIRHTCTIGTQWGMKISIIQKFSTTFKYGSAHPGNTPFQLFYTDSSFIN